MEERRGRHGSKVGDSNYEIEKQAISQRYFGIFTFLFYCTIFVLLKTILQ